MFSIHLRIFVKNAQYDVKLKSEPTIYFLQIWANVKEAKSHLLPHKHLQQYSEQCSDKEAPNYKGQLSKRRQRQQNSDVKNKNKNRSNAAF